MKSIAITLFCLIINATISYSQRTLTVIITNVQKQEGLIEIGLYNDSEKFPVVGEQYKVVRLKPEGKELKHTFTGLEDGKYAISIYHDENADNKCNRNLIGIPTEAYAFSNNFRPKFSIPTFKDCSFLVIWDAVEKIKLVY